MIDVRNLVEEIRQELKPLDEKILSHPYLNALEEGKVAREKLKLFAGQQYHIITSDLRSIGFLVSRYGTSPSGEFCINLLQGEMAALKALHSLAQGLGIKEDELKTIEPLPGAHAYTAFVAWLALYGSDAEFAAAFLVNLPAWGANCERMSRILKQRYGLQQADVAFFDLFAQAPPGFKEACLKVIETGLARGIEQRGIKRAAQLLQGYELMYWDTMYQNSL